MHKSIGVFLTACVAASGAIVLFHKACTGAADCRVCKNCSSCRHCAKEGGTCGVCAPTGKTQQPTAPKVGATGQGPSEPLSKHWRWAIKTGADRDAQAVSKTQKDTTVDQLIAIARPEVLTRRQKNGQTTDRRLDPVETTLYRVRGAIVGYKLEPDGDYHIVIQGSSPDKTMVVEIPDPADVSASSRWIAEIKSARSAFAKRFPTVGKRIKRANVSATITGVGFWDKKHGQTGVAPNGIELHPVIQMELEVKNR
jgi:hypothetical protein